MDVLVCRCNADSAEVFYTYLWPVVWLLALVLLVCVLGVGHTYLFYPLQLRRGLGRGRRCKPNQEEKTNAPWPDVHLLMAVHNEATVLLEKLASIDRQIYPGRLSVHIGSDKSTDATNDLLREYADTSALPVNLQLYASRRGKPRIINELAAELADAAVLLLTDASVMLQPTTVTELVRPFRSDPALGLTDSTPRHTHLRADGISRLEDRYIRGEAALKRAESERFGRFIGPFGGCWAIRRAAFRPVPNTFLVDDFYLCMAAYRAGWTGRTVPEARVTEAVGQRIRGEFRRKVRIGAGNWQNLVAFRDLWWPPWKNELAYAFFSHKVLRWLTPLLLLVGALAWLGIALLSGNYWVWLPFVLLIGSWGLSIIGERVLAASGIDCTRVRALTYFTVMNLALLLGLLRYLNGIRSNVWQPSDRSPTHGSRRHPR
jgi:cellulose synthase/poly-beta-1,6-N-acetylglucosamine synthase-like glycosyltransferase